jgi:hypothetical protein
VVLPAFTPVTTPVAAISATDVFATDQVPPPDDEKVVVPLVHTLLLPDIGAGNAFTVMIAVAMAVPQLLLIV